MTRKYDNSMKAKNMPLLTTNNSKEYQSGQNAGFTGPERGFNERIRESLEQFKEEYSEDQAKSGNPGSMAAVPQNTR